jgi:hypothetical protein
MQPTSSVNNFFGIKVSKQGVPVYQASDSQLLYKNDFSTQTFFASSGNIAFGVLSDGGLGQQITDSTGFVLFKLEGQTWFWYDKTTNKNIMQVGLLPDGTYGWAIAKAGYNVADGF